MNTNIIIKGDCIEELKKFPDNSIDAIITDSPYGLEFMGKDWDKFKKGLNIGGGTTGIGTPFGRSKPLVSLYQLNRIEKQGFQDFTFLWASECLRVLKPGAYLLSFGGTRTYHRMVCGIEDAGFEIRDCIMWVYGSGFPKSLNIGKQIDKIQGTSEWEGWGTALKPAVEPIVVARKPLSEKNVALNVLKWGTGGINIDACRVGTEGGSINEGEPNYKNNVYGNGMGGLKQVADNIGRFPANIILDEEAGKMLDEQAGNKGAFAPVKSGQKEWGGEIYHKFNTSGDDGKTFYDNGKLGGASRFFYCAKASNSERNNGCDNLPIKDPDNRDDIGKGIYTEKGIAPQKNNHPTVKPIKLMEYLIKLISRENAIILDPFLGSGTTAIACLKTNRKFIGIEKEEDYIKIANARIKPFLEQKKL